MLSPFKNVSILTEEMDLREIPGEGFRPSIDEIS